MTAEDGGTWTAERIRALGVRTDVPTAGAIFGLGQTQAYAAVKSETFPVPVVRVGPRRLVVPVAPILRVLGLDDTPAQAPQEAAQEASHAA